MVFFHEGKVLFGEQGKVARDPRCCCRDPSACTNPIEASLDCVVYPATITNHAQMLAWLDTHEFDVIWPVGFQGFGCGNPAKDCDSLDGMRVTCTHRPGQGPSNLVWFDEHAWCGTAPDPGDNYLNQSWVSIYCDGLSRCHLQVGLGMVHFNTWGLQFAYSWDILIPVKLDLRNVGLTLLAQSVFEDDNALCGSGGGNIGVQSV